MKTLLSATIVTLALLSTSAYGRDRTNYQCIGATDNLADIHYDLSAAYSELADIMRNGSRDRARIVYLQHQIVNGNNALPAAQQQFNYICSQ